MLSYLRVFLKKSCFKLSIYWLRTLERIEYCYFFYTGKWLSKKSLDRSWWGYYLIAEQHHNNNISLAKPDIYTTILMMFQKFMFGGMGIAILLIYKKCCAIPAQYDGVAITHIFFFNVVCRYSYL